MTRAPWPRRSARGSLRRTVVLLLASSVALATALPADAAKVAALPPRVFGVALPGAPSDLRALGTLTEQLGRAPGSVTWYAAWSSNGDFPAADAARIAATGATPEVTWEPWDPALGVDQPAFALDRITAGDHDAYLSRWATQIRSYAKPVTVRLAHEMNAGWYPWSEQVNGNGAGDYAAAWRHVVDLFRAKRVRNVTWRWAPNVPYDGSAPLPALYPGDAYVDQLALDGYNWATLHDGSTWRSFAQVFGPGLTALRSLSARPVYIGEVGCPEAGGDKAAWVADMFAVLQSHPEIRGVTWFSFEKEADWRIDSSPASLSAFASGLTTFR